MEINEKINKLRWERGWSVYTLACESGLTPSTLESMLKRNSPPKIETLQAICDAFGITLSQFFLDDEHAEMLSAREKQLISLFRKLNTKKQQAIIDMLND